MCGERRAQRWPDVTTGAKTGQLEKAEDNWQGTEATKLAKPNLRATGVTNQPEKQNPMLNRNNQIRLAGRSGRDESTQAQTQQKPDRKHQSKRAGNHKGGQGAPPDKSETLPPMCTGSPTPTPTLNRCQKTPRNKGQELPLEIQVNTGTSKAKPKTGF